MTVPLLQLIAGIALLAFALACALGIYLLGMRIGARLSASSRILSAAPPEAAPDGILATAPKTNDAAQGAALPFTPAVASSQFAPEDAKTISVLPTAALLPVVVPPKTQEVRPRFDIRSVRAFGMRATKAQTGAQVSWLGALVEWGIVLVGVWLFSTDYLTLGTRRPLSGPEAEIFQTLDWVLVNNLKNFGEFPQWNPFVLSGLPYVGDPFLHLFNPLVTLPVLWIGVWDGYKVGVFLSLVAAGISAWYLGKVMGVGRVSRVWLALSYAFTGRAVAQFLQGQYDLIFSYAWIPLCLAGFIALEDSKRPFHVALTALGLALLFLSGNVYYTFYMVFVFLVFALVYGIRLRKHPLQIKLNGSVLTLLLLAGILAAVVSAAQLLPFAQLWTQLNKQGDPALKTAHTFAQIWLDYTSTLPEREDTKFFAQETYSYVGYVPFLGLLLVPLAWMKQKKRVIVFMLLLFALAVLWASARETPLRPLFESSAFLTQFRYPTRFLLYGALALLALTALGFDTIFKFSDAGGFAQWNRAVTSPARLAATAGAALVLAVVLWSVADVYVNNKRLAISYNPYEASWETAQAVSEFDASPNYVQTPYSWVGALVSNGLRNLGMFYGYSLNRDVQEPFNRRPVPLRANYYILAADQTLNLPNAQRVLNHKGLNVYRLPDNLPFAFVAGDEILRDAGQGELRAAEVTAARPQHATANTLAFELETPENATLVVLTPQFSGWRVQVDAEEADLRNIDGYLGVATRAGKHVYAFTFDSWLFKVGLAISVVGLMVTGYLLLAEAFQWRVPFWERLAPTAVL